MKSLTIAIGLALTFSVSATFAQSAGGSSNTQTSGSAKTGKVDTQFPVVSRQTQRQAVIKNQPM